MRDLQSPSESSLIHNNTFIDSYKASPLNSNPFNVSFDALDEMGSRKTALKTYTPLKVRPASTKSRSMTRRVNQQNQTETKNFEKLYYELQEKQSQEDAQARETITEVHEAIEHYKVLLKQQSEHFAIEKKLWTNGTQENQVINHLIQENKLRDVTIMDLEQKYTIKISQLRAEANRLKAGPPDVDSSIMSDVKELQRRLAATESINQKIKARFGIK